MKCDVLVAGGGSAGLAAAVAAARLGAQTLLIERQGSLGGMAPGALVHSICGLYLLAEEGRPPVLANRGFASEFATRLLREGGASGPVRMGRVDVVRQVPTAFACLADAITRETPNLQVRLHTEVTRVASELGRVDVCCRGAHLEIEPRAVVDATGDAVVATLCGAPCEREESSRLQRPAFIFALSGVAAEAAEDEGRVRIAGQISAAVRAGDLPAGALGTHLRTSGRAGELYVTIDLAGGENFDPTDAACLTALEMEGRVLAMALWRLFAARTPGFSASYISAFPSRVGVRESRRIVGRYRLEGADLEQGAEFSDSIALATWPRELRETATGPRLKFPAQGRPCGIPLRTLQARDHAMLFMAGRCLSASHEALASTRVIGTCLATGEAAGLAAALHVASGSCDAAAVTGAREAVAR